MFHLRLAAALVRLPAQQSPREQHRVLVPREEAAVVAGRKWQAVCVHSARSGGRVSFHSLDHEVQDLPTEGPLDREVL